MAIIEIKTTQEEQKKVVDAIRRLGPVTVPMSKLADEAGVTTNRVRYIITDLLEAGKIVKNPTKAINKYYVRYSYAVVEQS